VTGQHIKPSSHVLRSGGAHRKPRPSTRSTIFKPLTAVVAIGVLAGAGIAAAHGSWLGGQPAALNHAQGADAGASGAGAGPSGANAAGAGTPTNQGRSPGSDPSPKPQVTPKASHTARQHKAATPTPTPTPTPAPPRTGSTYANPLRAVSGLFPERIDMGVDFGGAGPVYALGDAVITNAMGDSTGWPGGGWITYQLTSGQAKGLVVYLAEDVTPAVQVGQHVTSSTVIGNMFNGSAGIETGWAMPDGSSAESQLPEAGGISGQGPFPTVVGLNFEELLQKLGVAAAPNRAIAPSGLLPAGYPTW
jgi:hypothetical protein